LDASDIVDYYSKAFNWKPGTITIKIYSNNSEVSAIKTIEELGQIDF
jgi:hypothetical protein